MKSGKWKILWTLFRTMLYISTFTFGGGFVIVTFMKRKFVDEYKWIDENEMLDMTALAQSSPGPIAVNAATFVGNRVAGIPGALAATAGVVLPSCLFVTGLAWLYQKYRSLTLMQGILRSLRPAVVAMIFGAGLTILIPTLFADGTVRFLAGNFQVRAALLFLVALVCLRKWKLKP